MKVEIKKSSLKTVPPGEHTVLFTSGRWGSVYMDGIGANYYYGEDGVSDGLAKLYTGCWMEGIPSTKDVSYNEFEVIEKINSNGDVSYDQLKNDLLKYLNNCRNDISKPEEYKQAAKDIFGLEDLNIPESMVNDDGTVQLWGHGGFIRKYSILSEIKENDIITVNVQTYADFSRTVESHVYEFKYEDHGDYLKIISIEMTEKGEYDPEDRYVA